jgi:threonine aldolase
MKAVRNDHCGYHKPVTRLLSLENTLDGAVMPLDQVESTVAAARANGLACHLDGARRWNACAASGGSEADFAAPFDTISVCLSKGLGAPVGSLLVGSAAHIERARHFRKYIGGGWRQAGLLAAAGLHAIHNHRQRLGEDHQAATELADGLTKLGFAVRPPQTNMVWCAPPDSVGLDGLQTVAATLARDDGILFGSGVYEGPASLPPSIRFVTHMQTPRATAVKSLLQGLSRVLRVAK